MTLKEMLAKECHPREWDQVTACAAERGFLAGFEKAREMALKHPMECKNCSSCIQLISKLGEEEVD